GLIGGLLIISQAWLLASILQALIMDNVPRENLINQFLMLVAAFIFRAIINAVRERVGFICGKVVRQQIRSMVLDKLEKLGPVWV
ncbi:ABC transporter transmembrane domain-containing protein, partial [Xenorhabdus bovienii]|uniref:ABC transporter transmembrane domain-containing protein n=2 Tax=Xenorhabdus TaxID=626 RepID=UPI0030B9BA34|nr:cysteine/glutathione ABC transporter permease/ATP-binding protein CydD [Xenorhabdus bovienii]